MIAVFRYLKGRYKEGREQLFCLAEEGRTWSHGFILEQSKLILNVRKIFLTVRSVWWRKLSREVVESP